MIIIEDDGYGLSKKQIEKLVNISSKNISQMDKEEDILLFIKEFGIDILVLFSFIPLNITIENVYKEKNNILYLKTSGIKIENKHSIQSGTKITIKRKNRNINYENRVISEYCRNIGSKVEINGKQILERPIIKDMIVSYNINKRLDLKQEIGIARTGNLCKLWTLANGIPLYIKTLSNINGYIFEIIKDGQNVFSDSEYCGIAKELYLHLVKRYEFYPKEIKQRIKELVFKHYNITKDPFLLNILNSFKLFNSNISVNINFLKEISRKKKIYGVLNIKDLKGLNTVGKTILVIDQFEIDLLVNGFNFNIIFLQKKNNKINIKNSIFHILNIKTKIFLSKKLLNLNKKVILTEDETIFVKEIGILLSKSKQLLYIYPKIQKINIKLIDQKLFVPSYKTISNGKLTIFIFKKHKTIMKAIQLFKSDKKNIEWMIPQIFY